MTLVQIKPEDLMDFWFDFWTQKRSWLGAVFPSAADQQYEGKTQKWGDLLIVFMPGVLNGIKLTNAFQSKQLRKLIQQTFQQYATLKEDDCMVKFFETLRDVVSYDEEVFPCELVVSQ